MPCVTDDQRSAFSLELVELVLVRHHAAPRCNSVVCAVRAALIAGESALSVRAFIRKESGVLMNGQ